MNAPNLTGEVVIDASVLVKFFLPEREDGEAAVGLLRAFHRMKLDFAVSELVLVEAANTVRTKAKQGILSADRAVAVTREIQRFAADLLVAPIVLLLPSIVKTGLQLDHPVYDTVYLALAEARGVPFVTADRTFYRKIRQSKLRKPKVYLLGELDL
ncbi:MAG: type II toxin-antitoxin system VapC family toxin [bacterium]|nr:type II toxin-antitoxin system VapC family toxin [bacterium]